jgi:hypothetical protein
MPTPRDLMLLCAHVIMLTACLERLGSNINTQVLNEQRYESITIGGDGP